MNPLDEELRAILLDIEGTTTPIAFVHEVLFSYAREHAREFLTSNIDSEEVRADIALLREEHALDISNDLHPPLLADEIESLAGYIDWLIARDRKSTGLKALQGKIWRQGYLEGSLKAQVFADVAPAFERWHSAGLSINIFSSGSVLAQQLLFAHTDVGDLTSFIDNYFDTNVGKKGEADSYGRIAAALDLASNQIVFISDVVAELDAAKEAEMKTLLSLRPGNQPQPRTNHQVIHSFDQIHKNP
ncbi:MAG TPA: acireductone synthase [Pyrinomonadaceae bacterium]|nr:acireductone synthase [Pyrinomonadaceae bacterium]